ncbi:energy-coupling factor transporter transmembrane component T family protein [Desulfurococcus mucosus]|uniref:Cobalt transport protein n=1 Tax=Desulfurococcus mucosus (strain ATCC 35584 / DSM 2162 / JCM 9187 / O7/1) TaxID=765177 RepID=E8R7U9_DESM0|nr:energy-coupling factor transporter transmembrane component T [Desulfurococcus mucosus]ADV64575.1 cobalt transport protein [Desulfurococcus mucosus DSM 2162]
MRRPHVYSTFMYAVVMTLAAFLVKKPLWLAAASAVSISIGFAYGGRRMLYLLALASIGLAGVFLNALVFANTGNVVLESGFIVVRKHAVEEFTVVSLRLLLIAGAGGVFALTHSSSEIARGLVREIGLPYHVALAVSYALRSIPLIKRDLDEIMFMRKQRGYGRIPLTPRGVSSVLTPLLSINYTRAVWGGVSAEVRGLRNTGGGRRVEIDSVDVLFFATIVALVVLAVY